MSADTHVSKILKETTGTLISNRESKKVSLEGDVYLVNI